ncbi:MAG: RagB/SusD family nutrient uptake outer membrane protein [Muribaculaceae bacterium]|nr:RagB/SusD family nutrient uptake outer membrane protein [Muribaculaceae bacterium]
MKTIKSFIKKSAFAATMLSLGLGTVACNDLLDTKPQGAFTSEQLGEDEAVDMMTAAYATLLCHYFGNNESFAGPLNNWVIDLRSDDALKGGDGVTMEGYMHQLEIGNVESNNDVINFKWRNNYFSISRCNTAIKALLAAGNLDEAVKASYIAEMKTLRAYYYFDMYRLFQKFPYFDETVANPSECRADEYTRAEIMSFIKQDLIECYKALPETQTEPGRFNRYVAAAVLAKVALFDSDWATAETYAGYVISSGQYELYPNFLDMSKPEMNNQYESVMAVQFSSANSPDQFNFCNCLNCTWSEGNLYGNGDDFYLASQDLVNAFRTDEVGLPYLNGNQNAESVTSADYAGNVDPRLDFTLGRIGMPWRGHMYNEQWCRNLELYGQYSGKKPYPAPENPEVKPGIVPWGASSLNYIIIRYADVMLMKAEALIEQNKDLDQARDLINRIRAKAERSVNPSYSPVDINPMIANYAVGQYSATSWNQDYARKAVRHERRVELAMEGHRWFDLLRWGTVVEVVNKYYDFEKEYQPYYSTANLTADELYFPIPLNQKDNAGDLYD